MKCILRPIIFILILIAFASCKKDNTAKNKLVFIFRTDNSEGVAYRDLMQSNGCSVTLIDKADIGTTDFSTYDMIVIGNNTDQTGTPMYWTISEANTLKALSKPMLLIGAGGLQLAEFMANDVCWGTCAGENGTSFTVVNSSANIYKSPKSITVPVSKELSIYTSSSDGQGYHNTGMPAGVDLIANSNSSSSYSPVILEDNLYGVFGYYDDVSKMTQAGKDFIVNLTYYTGDLTL